MKINRSLLITLSCILSFSFVAIAQEHDNQKPDTPDLFPGKRLKLKNNRGTVTARGFIGGESQDLYVINLKAGKTMTITIQSQQNKGDFSLCNIRGGFGKLDRCVGGEDVVVKYSTKSRGVKYNKFKRWKGTIPESGDYEISVVAYPGSARYALIVKVD